LALRDVHGLGGPTFTSGRTVTTTVTRHRDRPDAAGHAPGWLSRLGAWTGSHLRIVLIAWLVVLARVRRVRATGRVGPVRRWLAGQRQFLGHGTRRHCQGLRWAEFLDAPCIRLILLPVVLRLTGYGAWHQPGWLGRILPTVRFAH
jgi:hypothetical protein